MVGAFMVRSLSTTNQAIYISYAPDADKFVYNLKEELKYITSGKYLLNIQEKNPSQLDNADLVILIFSQQSITHEQCKKDWKQALGIKNEPLILTILLGKSLDDLGEHDLLGVQHHLHRFNVSLVDDPTDSLPAINAIKNTLSAYLPASLEHLTELPYYYDPRIAPNLNKLIEHIATTDLNNQPPFIHIHEIGWSLKSALAWELVKSAYIRHRFVDGICWIDFNESGQNKPAVWWSMIEKSILNPSTTKDDAYIQQGTHRRKFLFILDNFDPDNRYQMRFIKQFTHLHPESRLVVITDKQLGNHDTIAIPYRIEISPLTAEEAWQCLCHRIPDLPNKKAGIQAFARQIADQWRDPYILYLIASEIVYRGENDSHVWDDIAHNFVRHENQWQTISNRIHRVISNLTNITPDQISALRIFDDFSDITVKAFSSVWKRNPQQTQEELERETQNRLITLVNAGLLKKHESRFTYQLYPYFSHYLLQVYKDTLLTTFHEKLLIGYYRNGIAQNNMYSQWHRHLDDEYIRKRLFYHLEQSGRRDQLYQILTEDRTWFDYRDKNGMYDELRADIELTQKAFETDITKQSVLALYMCHFNEQLNKSNLVLDALFEPHRNAERKLRHKVREEEIFSGLVAIYQATGFIQDTDLRKLGGMALPFRKATNTPTPEYVVDTDRIQAVISIYIDKSMYQEAFQFLDDYSDKLSEWKHELDDFNGNRAARQLELDKKYQTAYSTYQDAQIKLACAILDLSTRDRYNYLNRLRPTTTTSEGDYLLWVLCTDGIPINNHFERINRIQTPAYLVIASDYLLKKYLLEDIYDGIRSNNMPITSSYLAMKLAFKLQEIAMTEPDETISSSMREASEWLIDQFSGVYEKIKDNVQENYNKLSKELKNNLSGNRPSLKPLVANLHLLCWVGEAIEFIGGANEVLDFVNDETQKLDDRDARNQLWVRLAQAYANIGELNKAEQVADKITSDWRLWVKCTVELYQHHRSTPDFQEILKSQWAKGGSVSKADKADIYPQLAILLYKQDSDLARKYYHERPRGDITLAWNTLLYILIYLLKKGKATPVQMILDALVNSRDGRIQDYVFESGRQLSTIFINNLIQLASEGDAFTINNFVTSLGRNISYPNNLKDIITVIETLHSRNTGQFEEIYGNAYAEADRLMQSNDLEESSKKLLLFAIAHYCARNNELGKMSTILELYDPNNYRQRLYEFLEERIRLFDNDVLGAIFRKINPKNDQQLKELWDTWQSQSTMINPQWQSLLKYCESKPNLREFIIMFINGHRIIDERPKAPEDTHECYDMLQDIIATMQWMDNETVIWDILEDSL